MNQLSRKNQIFRYQSQMFSWHMICCLLLLGAVIRILRILLKWLLFFPGICLGFVSDLLDLRLCWRRTIMVVGERVEGGFFLFLKWCWDDGLMIPACRSYWDLMSPLPAFLSADLTGILSAHCWFSVQTFILKSCSFTIRTDSLCEISKREFHSIRCCSLIPVS